MKFRVVHYHENYYHAQYKSGLVWHDVEKAETFFDQACYQKLGPKIGTFDEMKRFVDGMTEEKFRQYQTEQDAIVADRLAKAKKREAELAERTYEVDR